MSESHQKSKTFLKTFSGLQKFKTLTVFHKTHVLYLLFLARDVLSASWEALFSEIIQGHLGGSLPFPINQTLRNLGHRWSA